MNKSASLTNIGLHEENRTELGQKLTLLLADEYVLYVTTRNYHWNVTGPDFHSLHQQFESQYEQIADRIDQVAERTRAIGVLAQGNWPELVKTARSSSDPSSDLPAQRMLSELLALHEELIVQLRTDSSACSKEFNDVGTADFLTGIMAQHEKNAWMLRVQLETNEDEST